MDARDWLFFGITFAAIFFAVWSLRVAGSYKQQVENVQMAAGVARESASAFRHTAEALRKVVKAYEELLRQAHRRIQVVEEMNRMLLEERNQRLEAAAKRREARATPTKTPPRKGGRKR